LTKSVFCIFKYQFTSSHFDNVLLIRQYPVRQNLQKLRRAFKPDEYSLFSPVVINAFYNPTNNDISKEFREKYVDLFF